MRQLVLAISYVCLLNLAVNGQVNTPNGVTVPPAALFAYKVSDVSDAQLVALQTMIQNGTFGPSCVIIGQFSRQYNCHGYAWHVSTGGNQIGINQPTFGGVTPYVAGVNPSYTQTNYSGSQGKLRVRYSGDHSAVTTYDNWKFISKWGPGSLVKHSPNDVPPDYGTPSSYWTCNYAPPLTSTYLDGKLISGSFQNTTWGSHNMQIFWALDPDAGPTFSSTAGSTIINNQNSGTVNFTFNGPSNNGGLSVAFCGAPRYSFTFFKPSGAKMEVYPNPVKDEEVLVVSADGQNLIQAINTENEVNRIVKLRLLNERQEVVQEYLPDAVSYATSLKLKAGLKGKYFLRATFQDGSVQTKRVVVE